MLYLKYANLYDWGNFPTVTNAKRRGTQVGTIPTRTYRYAFMTQDE